MKRTTSLLIAIAMIAVLVPLSIFSVTATAGVYTPTLANTYNDSEADTLIWASSSSYASVGSIYGEHFNYWYSALLTYDSASGAYVVSDTSGFDTNGNSIRPDTTYESWTLGSGKLIIMAKTQATDTDGLALLRSLRMGDKLYLTGSFSTIAGTSGRISGVSLSKTAPAVGDDSSDDTSGVTPLASEFDLDISAPAKYNAGDSISVAVSPENITSDGISLITFDLTYDSDILTLGNTVDSDGTLDCFATFPSSDAWDNLSTAEDGILHVRYLTASMSPSDWAIADGSLVFHFEFDVADTATGDIAVSVDSDSIVAATNTASGTDKFTGDGASATVAENMTAVTLTVDAPATYIPGEEFSVNVSATNIKVSGGISFLTFDIAYNSSVLELTNTFDSNDALDCASALPSESWDNLTTVEDGIIKVRLLTASTDSAEWATADGDITLTLNFKTLETATASADISVSDGSVIAAQNTESGTDKYEGMGSSDTVVKGEKPVVPAYTKGDINADGDINALDYALSKRAVLGTFNLDGTQRLAADINDDGIINASDYTLIKRAVLGTYTIS